MITPRAFFPRLCFLMIPLVQELHVWSLAPLSLLFGPSVWSTGFQHLLSGDRLSLEHLPPGMDLLPLLGGAACPALHLRCSERPAEDQPSVPSGLLGVRAAIQSLGADATRMTAWPRSENRDYSESGWFCLRFNGRGFVGLSVASTRFFRKLEKLESEILQFP